MLWYLTTNLSIYHILSLLLLVLWILQIGTGVILSSYIAYVYSVSFEQLIDISRVSKYIWLIRTIHMLNPNILMISLCWHVVKGLATRNITVTKYTLWIIVMLLLIFILGTCFTGYSLVTGNMSYWAVIVILNILNILPVIGNYVLETILAGTFITTFSINRLAIFHYLLSLLSSTLLIIHVILIHRSLPGYSTHTIYTSLHTMTTVLYKDITIIVLFVTINTLTITLALIHPDNWIKYSTIITPAHIEPEVYFLPIYSIIKTNTFVIGTID